MFDIPDEDVEKELEKQTAKLTLLKKKARILKVEKELASWKANINVGLATFRTAEQNKTVMRAELMDLDHNISVTRDDLRTREDYLAKERNEAESSVVRDCLIRVKESEIDAVLCKKKLLEMEIERLKVSGSLDEIHNAQVERAAALRQPYAVIRKITATLEMMRAGYVKSVRDWEGAWEGKGNARSDTVGQKKRSYIVVLKIDFRRLVQRRAEAAEKDSVPKSQQKQSTGDDVQRLAKRPRFN
jgi:hypothetical protein